MTPQVLGIANCGLVTSVGRSAPAACAAIRAGLTNPTETRFRDSAGNWIMAHRASLAHPWTGLAKLTKMASMALRECLAPIPEENRSEIPLLLCVAEHDRPGRFDSQETELLEGIQTELGTRFSSYSKIVAEGRTGATTALLEARRLMLDCGVKQVAIAATDSLLGWPTLRAYDEEQRLLTDENPNGFIPGEGGGALLVDDGAKTPALVCTGIGQSVETATIERDEPLRGDGLTQAIKHALADAGHQLQDLDFRIADVSGEQYYFKEAALALGRILRVQKEEFDLWHPAESIGEAGALAGLMPIIIADAACRKGYAPGPRVLCHYSSDGGARAALVLEYWS